MGKKCEFHDWFMVTFVIMVILGVSIFILATLIYEAAQYRYSLYILIYIAICGIIAYWLLKKEMESNVEK